MRPVSHAKWRHFFKQMCKIRSNEFDGLPGSDLVSEGRADLKRGVLSESALLVLIAEPRLKSLGIQLDPGNLTIPGQVEHVLYTLIEKRLGPGAHSFYNSLIRRIVSFAHALEREQSSTLQAENDRAPK
jgi:hypothetical protein